VNAAAFTLKTKISPKMW